MIYIIVQLSSNFFPFFFLRTYHSPGNFMFPQLLFFDQLFFEFDLFCNIN